MQPLLQLFLPEVVSHQKFQQKFPSPNYIHITEQTPPYPLLQFCCRFTVVEPCRTTPLELSHNNVFAML